MSTKTMRLPPRRVSMPSSNTNQHVNNNNTTHSHKRKDRDSFDLRPPLAKSPRPVPVQPEPAKPPPVSSNHLLAGYLAYEFLTRGTLFGQMWDPARSQPDEEAAAPALRRAAEPNRADEGKHQRYVELANLMKSSRAHLPGIVNPSDLARLLQM